MLVWRVHFINYSDHISVSHTIYYCGFHLLVDLVDGSKLRGFSVLSVQLLISFIDRLAIYLGLVETPSSYLCGFRMHIWAQICILQLSPDGEVPYRSPRGRDGHSQCYRRRPGLAGRATQTPAV